MNIIFHTATAIGVTVLLTDTNRITPEAGIKKGIWTALSAFFVGFATHAAIDYMPHCYPINSKADALISLIVIILALWFIRKPYKLIAGLSFLGCIFPDIIDLLPQILNKYLGLGFPVAEKIFPWHWQEYTGAIINHHCAVSVLNQIILLLTIAMICWFRRTDLKQLV